jgi:hypothetical protein
MEAGHSRRFFVSAQNARTRCAFDRHAPMHAEQAAPIHMGSERMNLGTFAASMSIRLEMVQKTSMAHRLHSLRRLTDAQR